MLARDERAGKIHTVPCARIGGHAMSQSHLCACNFPALLSIRQLVFEKHLITKVSESRDVSKSP